LNTNFKVFDLARLRIELLYIAVAAKILSSRSIAWRKTYSFFLILPGAHCWITVLSHQLIRTLQWSAGTARGLVIGIIGVLKVVGGRSLGRTQVTRFKFWSSW